MARLSFKVILAALAICAQAYGASAFAAEWYKVKFVNAGKQNIFLYAPTGNKATDSKCMHVWNVPSPSPIPVLPGAQYAVTLSIEDDSGPVDCYENQPRTNVWRMSYNNQNTNYGYVQWEHTPPNQFAIRTSDMQGNVFGGGGTLQNIPHMVSATCVSTSDPNNIVNCLLPEGGDVSVTNGGDNSVTATVTIQ